MTAHDDEIKDGTGMTERELCAHMVACVAGSINMTGSTPKAATCGGKGSISKSVMREWTPEGPRSRLRTEQADQTPLLTLTRSYNMIVSDCREGGKHEDRDCDRIGEEIQGDV